MNRLTPAECAVIAALLSGIFELGAFASMLLVCGVYALAWSITQLVGPTFEEQFAQWAAEIEHDHSNVRSDRRKDL